MYKLKQERTIYALFVLISLAMIVQTISIHNENPINLVAGVSMFIIFLLIGILGLKLKNDEIKWFKAYHQKLYEELAKQEESLKKEKEKQDE
ncbi:hypothetical protein [Campylobacter sp. MIT 97-5078]|uniref:hypothetical protein n=1 Tax=Campylobacter sp. MIT 97-5078 TaxID=1548153 RepID=UPI0005135B90|nr:hypothetical protein [Campylobacter sp. MIT 97-5078]KGI55179.1 hypothetical protein LR59_13100 [Campylobacter sp. MIT 97-5078]TQR27275.1 hypothetical protein DMB91_04560 [Campylobacter sp. MIT 97-5078]